MSETVNMSETEKKSCSFQGHIYPHGAEVQIAEKCMVCKDGAWEETSRACRPSKSRRVDPHATPP